MSFFEWVLFAALIVLLALIGSVLFPLTASAAEVKVGDRAMLFEPLQIVVRNTVSVRNDGGVRFAYPDPNTGQYESVPSYTCSAQPGAIMAVVEKFTNRDTDTKWVRVGYRIKEKQFTSSCPRKSIEFFITEEKFVTMRRIAPLTFWEEWAYAIQDFYGLD